MNNRHIYIKAEKSIEIIGKRTVLIKDILSMQGDPDLVNQIQGLQVFLIPEEIEKNYLISILDIIHAIRQKVKNVEIHNVGENDILIVYSKEEKKVSKIWTGLKILFISFILITGAAVAIMTFQTDAQLPAVFNKFYYIVLGNNDLQPYLIEVPYSIGIAIGISLFFNHFSKIKFSNDPTPIQVELKLYKTQVEDSIIEAIKDEKEGKDE